MQVCFFDIDGTLIVSGGAGSAALEGALCEEFGVTLNGKVSYSGRTDRAIARDLFLLHDIDDSPEHWQRLQSRYLTLLPDRLAMFDGQILPGVVELLEFLQERQIVLGLLTGNVPEGARLKLGHFGLFDYFEFGAYGDRHVDRNAVAQDALETVRAKYADKSDPDRIWVIGDTPSDVRCGRAIGARVAAVMTGWHSREELEREEPDLLLADLRETDEFVRMIG